MGADGLYTVLYFLDYGKSFGGAVNTLIQQAALMKQAGHKVILFFSNYLGEEIQIKYKIMCRNLGLRYEWETYQITSQTEDIDIICIYENYEKIKRTIFLNKPDILHSVQINPCVELISRELNIPHIMNVYPLIPEFFSIEYMNIFPHYHICDSWYYAEKWKRYLKTDSTCIRTIVNEKKSRRSNDLSSVLKFICVGSIYKEKNQLTVIKAFHKAIQSGIQGSLTLCGYADNEYGEECKHYIEKNSLQKDIIVKDFCADMDREYLNSDILICGSVRESYPNAISEAMAYGLLIISTPVGGVPEVIRDGENGYLTQNYTVDAIYEKMIHVKREIDSGRVKRVLDNADKTFMEIHSPQAVKGQLIRYYQYVLEDYEHRLLSKNHENEMDIYMIRQVFKSMVEKFNQNKARFRAPSKVSIKLWYLFHIKKEMTEAYVKGKEFFIWGAGSYGIAVKKMLKVFLPEIQINGFIDSKKLGNFGEYVIYHPEEILGKNNVIVFIAAVRGQNEIRELLEDRKMVYNKDYFILVPRNW